MAPRIARLASVAVLQLGALVLAHQLTYVARYGSRFGEALIHSGHGDAWTAAVVSSVALGVALATLGGLRLAYLATLLRRVGPGREIRSGLARGDLLRRWLLLAPKVAVVTLVLLTVQENLEHAAIGLVMPGPGILFSPEYAGGAWIAMAVSVAASLVAALFEWRHEVLLARLRAARAALPRATTVLPRPVRLEAAGRESLLGRSSALRAPPGVAPAI